MMQVLMPLVLAALQVLEQELIYFAAFWFMLGALDEFAVDSIWIALRLRRWRNPVDTWSAERGAPLTGRVAVFVAAWQEAQVIGHMIAHTLRVWPQRDFCLYVGCYGNDPATVEAAMKAAAGDPRLRIVIHERAGPTTKADCLNRVYRAMCEDESRGHFRYRGVVMHDAEDMVHPDGIAVIDAGLADADFVQLPVRPEPQVRSPWIAGQYGEIERLQLLAASNAENHVVMYQRLASAGKTGSGGSMAL